MILQQSCTITVQCNGKHLFAKRLTVSGPSFAACREQIKTKGWITHVRGKRHDRSGEHSCPGCASK